jgi:hypothetical protein
MNRPFDPYFHDDGDGDRGAPRRSRRSGDERAPRGLLRGLFDNLRMDREAAVSPDVTDSVMRRLGYARASEAAMRRERLSIWGWRIASTTAVLAFLGLILSSVHVTRYEASLSESVEEVLRAKLEERSRWLGDVAEGLEPLKVDRMLVPQLRTLPLVEPEPLPFGLPHPASEGTAPAEAPLKKV